MKINQVISLGILLFASSLVYAQDGSDKEYVKQTFSHWQLINTQTTEVIPQKGYEFRIQHRFGAIEANEDLYEQFLGMDLPANIRIAFGYAINDRAYFGIGRTKNGKTYDFEAKYKILRQTKDNSTPVSVAAYFNTAAWTTDFPTTTENHFFTDSTTVFEYSTAHRLSYNTQIIIARKFSKSFSMQIAPVFIYHNLVDPGKENYTVAIPVSGRLKIGMNSSVIFEYAHALNNRSDDYVDPISLGVEFGTVGHTFQFVISSSQSFLEQNLYTQDSYDYNEGSFLLGFNIKRTFWRKK